MSGDKGRVVALAQEMFADDWPNAVGRLEQFAQEVHDAAIEAAAREIVTSTGPTGGWLDSPKAVAAAISALKGGA